MSRITPLVLLAALSPAWPALAGQAMNPLVVTTTADGLDAFDGACSLREAIHNANGNIAFSPVNGECPSGRDDMTDVIVLQSGATYLLTEAGPGMDAGDLDILDELLPREVADLRIETAGGAEQATIRQMVNGERVIENFGATVEIDNVVIRGGNGVAQGGGIRNETGHLTLTRCGLIGNQAGQGGGLWSGGNNAHASLTQCEVLLNQSSGGGNPSGAGIRNDALHGNTDSTELLLSDTVVRLNTTTGFGGGLHADGGRVVIREGSVISLNSARGGGGVVFSGGADVDGNFVERILVVDASDSSFESNTAFDLVIGSGGGVQILSLGPDPSRVRMRNVDFVGNHSASGGGGLVAFGTEARNFEILGGSFVNNTSAKLGAGMLSEGGLVSGTRFESNVADLSGGAMTVIGGRHAVFGATFVDNRADGAAEGVGFGGAIAHQFTSPGSVLEVRGCEFIGNTAQRGGGAIHGRGVDVLDSHFEGNSANVDGGAIHVTASALIRRSRLIGNSAVLEGGALWIGGNGAESSVMLQSVVANNEAALGGGIYLNHELVLGNTTISGNRAVQGGGLYIPLAAEVTAVYSTITNNTVGRDLYKDGNLVLQNSIFGTPGAPSCTVSIDNPSVVSFGFNLSADAACGGFDQPGDQSGVDPMVGPLLDAAGGTMTHEPLPGSPAIDAANPDSCGEGIVGGFDQRGALRPSGDHCDIGAHERGAQLPARLLADGFE